MHDGAIFVAGIGTGIILWVVIAEVVLRGDVITKLRASVNKRTVFWASIAQVAANICFGVGSVIGKMGLPNVNPVMFATARELGASGIVYP